MGPFRRFALLAGLLLAGLWSATAGAHFLLNINIRVIHVEHLAEGLRVYLRLPMPLLVANLVGPEQEDGTRLAAPYTQNVVEEGQLMHYLDDVALRDDPLGLGQMVADGHELLVDDAPLEPRVEAVRVHDITEQPLFSSLEQAKAAIVGGPPYPDGQRGGYVGDTVVDVQLFYPAGGAVYDFAFMSRLRPGIEGEEKLANLLLDHVNGGTKIYRAEGLLDEPIVASSSRFAAAATFIEQGIWHILEGIDHLLFVVCLAIGALTLGDLLWRVTGFTLGHTVTLIAGFVPAGAWFIPAIETAIALSIVYAGVIVLLKRTKAATAWVTAAIGLLHGFGFSFVLHEVLRLDSPDLWVSLLSFNLGVEIGQVAIILAIWPALYLLDKLRPRWASLGRSAVALPCIAIAALWAGQRIGLLIQ